MQMLDQTALQPISKPPGNLSRRRRAFRFAKRPTEIRDYIKGVFLRAVSSVKCKDRRHRMLRREKAVAQNRSQPQTLRRQQ
jgi:hypothetical protein